MNRHSKRNAIFGWMMLVLAFPFLIVLAVSLTTTNTGDNSALTNMTISATCLGIPMVLLIACGYMLIHRNRPGYISPAEQSRFDQLDAYNRSIAIARELERQAKMIDMRCPRCGAVFQTEQITGRFAKCTYCGTPVG